jgi:hypothetical protein
MMSNGEEIVKNWEKKRPTEVRVREVIAVLEEFFPGKWEWKKSSHIVVTSEILAIHPQFRLGIMTVPTVSGKTVRNCYISNIIKAIGIIKQYKDWKDGKKT